MLRGYKIVTVTHKSIDVGDLGAYVVPEKNGSTIHLLQDAKKHFQVEELMYVQTCNRIMFILFDSNVIVYPKLATFLPFSIPKKTPLFIDSSIVRTKNF